MEKPESLNGEEIYASLDEGRRIFVDEKAKNVAGGPAWRAGHPDCAIGSCYAQASVALRDHKIQAAIEWRRSQAAKRRGIDLEEIVEAAARIVRHDPATLEAYAAGDIKSLADLPLGERFAINSIEVTETKLKDGRTKVRRKVTAESKAAALRILAPFVGMATERAEVPSLERIATELAALLGVDRDLAVRALKEESK